MDCADINKGWDDPRGDEHFKKTRLRADHANKGAKRIFFEMRCQIGGKLHCATSALTPATSQNAGGRPMILDLCMAPGGFAASVLKADSDALVCGISLPISQGGHDMLLPNWQSDTRVQVQFLDITMLAVEIDVTDIPDSRPDAANFLPDRPFYGDRFDLVLCDGQVLRMHPRAEYREKREAWRLLTSQLVLATQRIKKDGKMVILLHKLDAFHTILLLHTLSKFASLQLFKPVKEHAVQSSLYVVAEHIQPESTYFQEAVTTWKNKWRIATFGSEAEYEESKVLSNSIVGDVLRDFGTKLIELGEPIWAVQSAALRKAPWSDMKYVVGRKE
jgi:23S rRNA U2552 (ribose-2'-O)-methylase RlmE/FtsJ